MPNKNLHSNVSGNFNMTIITHKKLVLFATITCSIFLLLIVFFHYIDKYLTGTVFVLLTLLIPITFLFIVTITIIGLIQIFNYHGFRSFKLFFPVIITLTTMAYTFFSPFRLDSENFESNVLKTAYHEGTQNFSYFILREDKTFEARSSSFVSSSWFYGDWKIKCDTLFLKFETRKPYNLNDTMIIHKNYLVPSSEIKYFDSLHLNFKLKYYKFDTGK
jgi:hypothetical protein